MVSERRITAAKPARLRRDVAGFGPVGTEHPLPASVDGQDADTPIVRVTLVPAEDANGVDSNDATDDAPEPPDWREW